MLPVGIENAAEHRQFDVALFGQVHGGTQILRQAGAAESVSGLEVGGRYVELPVLADQFHHLERIDAKRMAEPRGLVCEGDLQGMEVVAAELEHLGRAHGGDMELARQVTEQFAQLPIA